MLRKKDKVETPVVGSKLCQLLSDAKVYQIKASEYIAARDNAKKKIEELLEQNFRKLKSFLQEELYKGLPEDVKAKVDEEKKKEEDFRKGMELLKQLHGVDADDFYYQLNSATCYCATNYFNPFKDSFEIYNYELNSNNEVKFTVEDITYRCYLGITGAWIPTLYSTEWIPLKKLLEYEE